MNIPKKKQKIRFSPQLARSIGKSEKEPISYLKTIISFAAMGAVLFFIFSGLQQKDIPISQTKAQSEVLGASDSGPLHYSVNQGDTLISISQKYNIYWMTIVEENELEPPYDLLPGQILRIPAK